MCTFYILREQLAKPKDANTNEIFVSYFTPVHEWNGEKMIHVGYWTTDPTGTKLTSLN